MTVILHQARITAYYQRALRERRTTTEKLLAPTDKEFLLAIRNAKPHSGNALDLGYGNGQYVTHLAKLGYSVTAIDRISASILRARLPKLLRKRVFLRQGNIANLTLGNARYRIVVARDCLHFLSVRRIATVLTRIVHASAQQSVHYITFFANIQRIGQNGERVRIAGEANLTKSAFQSLVKHAYQGWHVNLHSQEYREVNHDGIEAPFTFIANRLTVIATRS